MSKILAVGDDQQLRLIINQTLHRRGDEVRHAAQGRTALRMAAERSFDVALVDGQLTDGSGLEVLTRLRRLQPGCLRIVFSEPQSIAQSRAAWQRGEISEVLEKPVHPAVLEEGMTTALDLRQRMADVIRVQQVAARIAEVKLLQQCLDTGLIRLALQPIIDPVTRSSLAFEAFLRSEHAVLSGPLSVLRVAEQHGMLPHLADAVFQQAARWLPHLPVATRLLLNLHPDDLLDIERMNQRLATLQPWARQVVFKVHEEGLYGREQALEQAMERGFSIAIADLGSGRHSISTLATLRPRFIKLDMSLIRGVDADAHKQSIVAMLCRFTESIGAKMVAEGVETEEEARALVDAGAHLLQGYLFGRPSTDLSEVLG